MDVSIFRAVRLHIAIICGLLTVATLAIVLFSQRNMERFNGVDLHPTTTGHLNAAKK